MAFSLLRDLLDLLDKKSSAPKENLNYKPLVEGLQYACQNLPQGGKIYSLRFLDREMLAFSYSVIGMFLNLQEFEKNMQASFAGIYAKLDAAQSSPQNVVDVKLSEDEMIDFFALFEEMQEQEEELEAQEMDNLNNIHNVIYAQKTLEKPRFALA
jgi:hypothetical protein